MATVRRWWQPADSVPDDVDFLRAAMKMRDRPIESTLLGPSMGEAIPSGVRIRIQPVRDETWAVGRVVVCASTPKPIVHRIVHLGHSRRAQPYLLTCGDGNWLCDAPILRTIVLGEVEQYLSQDVWRAVDSRGRLTLARRLSMAGSLRMYVTVMEASPLLALWLGALVTFLRHVSLPLRLLHVRP